MNTRMSPASPRDQKMIRVEIPRDIHGQVQKLAHSEKKHLFLVMGDALKEGFRTLSAKAKRRDEAKRIAALKQATPAKAKDQATSDELSLGDQAGKASITSTDDNKQGDVK